MYLKHRTFLNMQTKEPKKNVNKFVAFVNDKYFAKDGEVVDDQEFNRDGITFIGYYQSNNHVQNCPY